MKIIIAFIIWFICNINPSFSLPTKKIFFINKRQYYSSIRNEKFFLINNFIDYLFFHYFVPIINYISNFIYIDFSFLCYLMKYFMDFSFYLTFFFYFRHSFIPSSISIVGFHHKSFFAFEISA